MPGGQLTGQKNLPEIGALQRAKDEAVWRQIERATGRKPEITPSYQAVILTLRGQVRGVPSLMQVTGQLASYAAPYTPAHMKRFMQQAMPGFDRIGGGSFYNTGISKVYVWHAPHERFGQMRDVFSVMMGSVRVNPVWDRAMAMLRANIARINLKGIKDRADMWRKAHQEISAMRRSSWKYAMRTMDRSAQRFTNYIRGVRPYRNPQTGGVVNLPFGYQNAWTNGSGLYLVSPKVGFNPNGNPGYNKYNWTKMNKTQP